MFISRMEAFHMIRSLLDGEMQEKIIVGILEKDLNLEEIVNFAKISSMVK